MKHFFVCSPVYEVIPRRPFGEPPEPGELGRDVVEIEAQNRADALVLGVKLMRKEYPHGWHNYENPDCNPYVGMLVEEVPGGETDDGTD